VLSAGIVLLLLLRWILSSTNQPPAATDLTDLIALIEATNRDSAVINQLHFSLAVDHIPIVLYVYNRPGYLKKVLAGLRRVRGIEGTLLIVSHDGAVSNMLQLIRDHADFCQVKELVHPVSAHSPCTEAGCGIFRLKAHWWWLQQMVWRDPAVLSLTSSSWRLFLEEDHLLALDAYELLQQMVRTANMSSGSVWGVGLAPMLDRTPPLHHEPAQLLDYHWGVQNQGYAFPNSTWRQLEAASTQFWQFHDGWDITLLYLMQLKLLPRCVLLPRLARLQNIGSEGATQDTARYQEFGFDTFPVSDGRQVQRLEIGGRTLGKDPSALPVMGPYGESYDWDAIRPGQLNNNWEANYGASMRDLPRWKPGEIHNDRTVDTLLGKALLGSVLILGVWVVLLLRK